MPPKMLSIIGDSYNEQPQQQEHKKLLCKFQYYDMTETVELTEEEVSGARKVMRVLEDWSEEDIYFMVLPDKVQDLNQKIANMESLLQELKQERQNLIEQQ